MTEFGARVRVCLSWYNINRDESESQQRHEKKRVSKLRRWGGDLQNDNEKEANIWVSFAYLYGVFFFSETYQFDSWVWKLEKRMAWLFKHTSQF